MKKQIYFVLLLATLVSLATSCTEEQVKPQGDNSGGLSRDPIK